MTRLHPLSEDLRNKISAGEVVERPASVIKELVENSLDSGADQIEVVVERGGHQLIQVRDNGSGIHKDDIQLCFQRYTTSKIESVDDLFSIDTLGFRGEALASIASVADVTIATGTGDSDDVWTTQISNGQGGDLQPVAGEKGSLIRVENLFYNTPARRKFLKSPKVELRHIVEIMKRFALSFPQIHFELTVDEKPLLQLPPTELNKRIGDVFDPTYTKKLLPVHIEKGDFTLTGYIGNLDLVRARPGNQYLFLNGRFIKDRLLNSAVYNGYQSLIKRGEYPFFALNMELPVDQVDVNVHPMKTEVRFTDEWRIYHVLKSGVDASLKDILDTIPDFKSRESVHHAPQLSFSNPVNLPPVTRRGFPDSASEMSEKGSTHLPNMRMDQVDRSSSMESLERAKSYASTLAKRQETDSGITTDNIWQVHNKYIISQIDSGLVIIDQHVAHERILFEEALAALEEHPLASQSLLFPEELTFSPDDFSVLVDIIPYLEKIGFRMKSGGKHSVIVEAVPSDIGWGREKQVVIDIIDQYINDQKEYATFQENIAASYSCHAAIKAGDPLTKEEMQVLVNRLFATKHPYYCPHGRPIIVQMSLSELDERFER